MNKRYMIAALLMTIGFINACPVKIINDQRYDIMVIDPYTGDEIRIEGKSLFNVKKEGKLEPHVSPALKWFEDKELIIKVQGRDKVYRPMYKIKQRKCSTTGEIVLTMSDIKKLVKKPTDLLEAQEISAEAKKVKHKKMEAKKKRNNQK